MDFEFVLRILLSGALIACIITGIVYAMRLEKKLAGVQASRTDMERFVHEFGATVARAEAGVKGLKQVARESGNDLERLIEKAQTMRDELKFVMDHADQLVDKVSAMSALVRQNAAMAASSIPEAPSAMTEARQENEETPSLRTRAERDFLRAIDKLR